MKSLQIELPDKVAEELGGLVRDGWFRDEGEVARIALIEFLRRYRIDLLERQQREDIAWALSQKNAGK